MCWGAFGGQVQWFWCIWAPWWDLHLGKEGTTGKEKQVTGSVVEVQLRKDQPRK